MLFNLFWIVNLFLLQRDESGFYFIQFCPQNPLKSAISVTVSVIRMNIYFTLILCMYSGYNSGIFSYINELMDCLV